MGVTRGRATWVVIGNACFWDNANLNLGVGVLLVTCYDILFFVFSQYSKRKHQNWMVRGIISTNLQGGRTWNWWDWSCQCLDYAVVGLTYLRHVAIVLLIMSKDAFCKTFGSLAIEHIFACGTSELTVEREPCNEHWLNILIVIFINGNACAQPSHWPWCETTFE